MNNDYQPPQYPQEAGAPGEGYPQSPPPPPRYITARPAATNATVTLILVGISVVIYALQFISQSALGVDIPGELGVKANSLILQGQYWRLFTPMFLHGSILHIAFNMYALYIFGPGLERHFGHLRFLLLYLLSGFAGNVFSFIFAPAPSYGASTAIFGLLGAEGIFIFRNRRFFGNMARTAITQIIIIAAINLVIGMSPGIDNWGHVGGLIGGTLFAWMAGPLMTVQGIPPMASIEDEHGTRELLLGSVTVGALFALLAVVIIYIRVG